MRNFVHLICVMCCIVLLSAADVSPQQRYIDRYAALAVQEMYRSGVPASITLAQGLLESRYGLSALAAEGHNHFGIKCHTDWKGKTMKVDDDLKGECFRVYDKDIESFRDHSDFLRYRDRYKFLFDYDIHDYRAWCYGLGKAGYATDPKYPDKLIKIIEDYDLNSYDSARPSDFDSGGRLVSEADDKPLDDRALFPKQRKKETAQEKSVKGGKSDRKAGKATRKTEKKTKQAPVVVEDTVLPESPNALEEVVEAPRDLREEFHFSTSRKIYTQNGVPFVYAREGETFATLAEENNLFLREIIKFNDLPFDSKLLPGTVVYLKAKKTQAKKGLDKYIVSQDGEDLREICQRFAVKQKSIMKLNGFSESHELKEGDTVILRK